MAKLFRTSLYSALFIALLSLASGQLLEGVGVPRPSRIGLIQIVGIVIALAGSAIALWCVLLFALNGRGTPIPLVPPRRLVIRGPYRVVRNPMAIGVGVALMGVAVFYESTRILTAVVLFMLAIHVMVTQYEEPTLRRTFGADYIAYFERVNRWIPMLKDILRGRGG